MKPLSSLFSPALLLLTLSSPALAQQPQAPAAGAELVLSGKEQTTLDLWRARPNADKVYVMVGLPDGSRALFMVDTGASVSVLNEDVAARLSLTVEDSGGSVVGLGGRAPWKTATIPSIRLGDFELRAVEVAVGVPGVPDHTGPMEVAGILGTNVWSQFTCVLDYPADQMTLFVGGTYKMRGKSAPLQSVNGSGAFRTPVEVRSAGTPGGKGRGLITQEIWLEIDTGAHDLLLSGPAGEPFRGVAQAGLEPVLGVGADLDRVPLSDFLQVTHRIPLTELRVGGAKLEPDFEGRWIGASPTQKTIPGMTGLVGYETFKDYRLIMDYPGGRVQIRKSPVPARDFDAVRAWLEQELATNAGKPERAQDQANAWLWLDDVEKASAVLEAALVQQPWSATLQISKLRLKRIQGDVAAVLALGRQIPPQALVEEGEWTAFLDQLVLDGQSEEALKRAQEALQTVSQASPALTKVEQSPQQQRAELLVGWADTLTAVGRHDEALSAIEEARRLSPGAGGHLLRQARIHARAGDRYGAMTVLRRLMHVYPMNGMSIWLYTWLLPPASPSSTSGSSGGSSGSTSDLDTQTFLSLVDQNLARLHAKDVPSDFLGAAWIATGRPAEGARVLQEGEARDCTTLTESPDRSDRDNCTAWFLALAAKDSKELERAEALVQSALKAHPTRSAYWDTAATVSRARGDAAETLTRALRAAQLSPDDPYLLWQLDRAQSWQRPQ